MHVCAHACVHACVRAHVCVCVCVCVTMSIAVSLASAFFRICTHTHTHTHTNPPGKSQHLNSLSQLSVNFGWPWAFSVRASVVGPRVVEVSVEAHAAAPRGIRCWKLFALRHFYNDFSQTRCRLRRSHFPFVQPAKEEHFENVLPTPSAHAHFVFLARGML